MEDVGEEPWWYRPDPGADMKAVTLEPEGGEADIFGHAAFVMASRCCA